MFSLKNNYKIRDGLGKQLLRKSFKGILPDSIRLRKDKMGHNIPFGNWIRTKYKNQIEEIINENCYINSEIYLPKKLKSLFINHCGGQNHDMFFWQYLNMYFWMKINFNQ